MKDLILNQNNLMNKKLFLFLFPASIVINTVFSVNQWSTMPIGNTFIVWTVNFFILGMVLWYKKKFFKPKNRKDYLIVTLYFVWMIFGVVRGAFTADNYWEWKQGVSGSLILSLPAFVYIFESPFWVKKTLKIWLKYAMPIFIIIFFFITDDSYFFYLGPILLLGCLLPIVPKYWRYLFIGLLLLMIFVDWDARSQVIKAFAAILLSIGLFLAKHHSTRIIKSIHWILYFTPLLLLFLGISGSFNPFKDLASYKGKYVQKRVDKGHVVISDLSVDTRTFIYVEVINSALRHGYTLWGRTPARGNDSVIFGDLSAEELKTGKYERFSNEVVFPNVFTWLGLIGMLLYCLIYLKSSYLSLYKSNSIFLKFLGLLIAFHFAYGWVEDNNRFDIANISIWMMIAMGLSEKFRKMTDGEFRIWVNSIFPKIKYSGYSKRKRDLNVA